MVVSFIVIFYKNLSDNFNYHVLRKLKLLTKGFEVEMYTGTYNGEIFGLSDKISADLENFEREPDTRNVEYITSPTKNYKESVCKLIRPRVQLREYLKLHNYTIIPGSTLSLGDTKQFFRSYPNNPYHDFIEKTYGTNVVTASIHINLGIEDPEVLMRVCRVVRMETSLYLALSASSPFLDNQVTGDHSTRWTRFPKTHNSVPLFSNHQHYIDWIEEQIKKKTMQNVRHLWTSVRPNGNKRPYELNRLELRVCDLISDPLDMLALTALLEARVLQIIETPEIDSLSGHFSSDDRISMANKNDDLAAKNSLDAILYNWETNEEILAKNWILKLYQKVLPFAEKYGFFDFIKPIPDLIKKGSVAKQWLDLHQKGTSIQDILKDAIQTNINREQEIMKMICCDSYNNIN